MSTRAHDLINNVCRPTWEVQLLATPAPPSPRSPTAVGRRGLKKWALTECDKGCKNAAKTWSSDRHDLVDAQPRPSRVTVESIWFSAQFALWIMTTGELLELSLLFTRTSTTEPCTCGVSGLPHGFTVGTALILQLECPAFCRRTESEAPSHC